MHPSPAISATSAALLLLLLASAALSPTASGDAITVGGKRDKWAPNVNYTDWASHQRFFLNDWLVFRWEKGMYDVVQVNATDYASCSADHPITNWSRGNKWAIQLNATGDWYFICSRGYCWNGMKLAVKVEPLPASPAPAPAASHNAAGTARPSSAAILVAAAAIVLLGLIGFGV